MFAARPGEKGGHSGDILIYLRLGTPPAWPSAEESRMSLFYPSDDGLVHLQGLTGLRLLYLRSPQVTNAGVTRLRQALPNCRIYGP